MKITGRLKQAFVSSRVAHEHAQAKSRFVNVDGANLHFVIKGRGQPVVLIHGLYSDPQSWADMINDLRASSQFSQRFQVWTFRYPTGQGFLQSAAKLRAELQAARQVELSPAIDARVGWQPWIRT